MEKKETVGKLSQDLLQKKPESRDPIELQREMNKDYVENLVECAVKFLEYCEEDFYISVLTKNEKLMPNVFRNFFFATRACPTPTYDQSVFRYDQDAESITFVWNVPSKETCEHFRINALQIDESERELLKFVLDFYDGSLDELAKKLNKEERNSPLIMQ